MSAIGVHLSISKGLLGALDKARELESDTIQIFIRNPRGYAKKVLNSEEVDSFISKRKDYGIDPLVVHGSYILNIASSDRSIRDRSIASVIEELRLSSEVAADYYVLHFGSNPDRETGLKLMRRSLDSILRGPASKPVLLLENTAGEGNKLGWRTSDFKAIFKKVIKRGLGVCLDSCHLFSSGVDLRDSSELDTFLEDFDKAVGIDNIKLLHINDCAFPCGSRKDRHAHIGDGFIKRDGISNFINHPKLKDLPNILETPKDKERDDIENLNRVKYLKMKGELNERLSAS
jgi:deoxyribonuclease IV